MDKCPDFVAEMLSACETGIEVKVTTRARGKHMAHEGIEVFREPEIENILKTKSKEDALTFFTDACQEKALHLQKQIPGNHVSWWNFEKIKNIMKKVGFKDAQKKKYNESDYEIFKNFDEKNKDSVAQKHYSVFVEAKK